MALSFPLKPFEHLPFINFMAWRPFWIWSSVAAVLAVFALLYVQGLNYGIDFVGGKLVEIQTQQATDTAHLRTAVDAAGFAGATIQQYGTDNDFIIRLPGNDPKTQASGAEQALMASITQTVGAADQRRVEFVGPQVGAELRIKGLEAMLVSVIAILCYVWLRFEFRFGLGAILSLCHDVILTIGIMCLLRTEITLTVLAAILTLIGYSLNETIVIFDRVRENRAKNPNQPLPDLINHSVNQTLGRTIMTGGSVLVVLWALFLFGGEAIHDFARTLLIGVALGTYSSIFVSSSTLLALEEYYQKMAKDDAARKVGRKG
jgi:preprotein translocase subunit SecF